MKIVVGLGNPGPRYEGSRHNLGFAVFKRLAHRLGAGRARRRFEGQVAEGEIHGHSVLLVAPQTYMNTSGRCVRQVVEYYQASLSDLLVICDDLNLPLGKLRLRSRGSSGGHKGLRDIIAHLGTEEYARLRVGVGPLPAGCDATEYVLERFRPEEKGVIQEGIERAAEAVELWVCDGIEVAMNQYN